MSTRLAPLCAEDAVDLARLHKVAFPGFFLSSLGERFLVQLYLGFAADPSCVSVTARTSEGTLVGAAVGTLDPAGFFPRLLRRRWRGFAVASILAAAESPRAIPRLLRAVRYRGGPRACELGAQLSSFFVDPAMRGSGLGRNLLEEWLHEVERRGGSNAFLATDAENNEAVNRFYANQGWDVASEYVTKEGRAMRCYTKTLRPT